MHRLIILLLLAAAPAAARLGETTTQLAARFGAPTKDEGDGRLSYSKNGIVINATLYQGKCVSITYVAQPKHLTGKQVQNLLALNAPSTETWKQDGDAPDLADQFYTSSSGKLKAASFNDAEVLMVYDPALTDKWKAEQATKTPDATAGF